MCSYKNNLLWTVILDDGEKMSQPLNLLALPPYCSQANSLTSPMIAFSVPAVKGPQARRDNDFTTSLPTVYNLPTIYAGSKSTDFNSPIPDTCVSRSFFEQTFNYFIGCVHGYTNNPSNHLDVHIYSYPDYLMISSVCDALGLPPRIPWNPLKKSLESLHQLSKQTVLTCIIIQQPCL